MVENTRTASLPACLIDRVEKAAQISCLATDTCQINKSYMILHNKTLVWWEFIEEVDIDLIIRDNIKAQFLKPYEPKYLTYTTCANFTDLVQRVRESVDDCHLKVQQAYKGL
jgi:hypothetical protein